MSELDFLNQISLQARVPYISVKNIRGRRYRYWQRTYREGGKVRTESRYLGPVDEYDQLVERGLRVAERCAAQSDAWQREHLGHTAQEAKDSAAKWSQSDFVAETSGPPTESETKDTGEADRGVDASSEPDET